MALRHGHILIMTAMLVLSFHLVSHFNQVGGKELNYGICAQANSLNAKQHVWDIYDT